MIERRSSRRDDWKSDFLTCKRWAASYGDTTPGPAVSNRHMTS